MTRPASCGFLPLIAVCLVAIGVFGSLIATSALIVSVQRDLGLTYGEAGFLLSAPFVAIGVFALAGGAFIDRIGMNKVLMLGTGLTVLAGAARAWGTGFSGFAAATLLVGAGVGMVFPVLPKIAAVTLPPEQRAFGSSLYTASVITGSGLAMALTHFMAIFPGLPGGEVWRGGYLGWALVLAAAFAFWLAAARAATAMEKGGEASSSPVFGGTVWRSLAIWGVAISLFIENQVFFTSIGWLPTILAEQGLSPSSAAGVVSLVPWMGVITVLVAHRVASWFGGERPLLWVCVTVTVLALLLLTVSSVWLTTLAAVAIGICANAWVLLCLGYPARSVPHAQAGQAAGLILGVGYLGGFSGPWLAGLIRESSGGFAPAFYFLAGCTVVGFWTIQFFGPPADKSS
ncbi:MAG: MFS transporter [bacterium]|nr:MFS transporter [bacterium]